MGHNITEAGDLAGKTVLVRCDFNVPLEGGNITDPGRILAAIPTIKFLISAGAKIVLMSHLGRPDGKPALEYSLRPVAERLSTELNQPVRFATDTVGPDATSQVSELSNGDVLLLENLRFHAGETSKDDAERTEFATQLAAFGDVYVSDGFGVVHRKQTSVYDIAKLLPGFAGLLVAEEVGVLSRLLTSPRRPYTVVLGGSKVSDKLGVIDQLIERVDHLLIGGGMVFTFLAALGKPVAKSLLESDQIPTVLQYLERAKQRGVDIVLPTDIVMASSFDVDAEFEVVSSDSLENTAFGSEGMGLDIGPESAQAFANIISSSATVFWNGPMGVFEFPNFASGTRAVAKALVDSDAETIIGGGDSAAAIRLLGFEDRAFSHISTGGGASLEYLEGKTLPGLEVIGWQ